MLILTVILFMLLILIKNTNLNVN